jgi:hypothetical protein
MGTICHNGVLIMLRAILFFLSLTILPSAILADSFAPTDTSNKKRGCCAMPTCKELIMPYLRLIINKIFGRNRSKQNHKNTTQSTLPQNPTENKTLPPLTGPPGNNPNRI